MIIKNIILVGIITAILFLTVAQINTQTVKASPFTLDIKKAKNPGPGFTDEKIGTVTINATVDKVVISSNVTAKPGQDKVFEGWLADSGGSNYKLSLGKYDKGTLAFSQNMVNPYTYKQFLITEEPVNDADPNAAATYGGVDLQPPFGQ